MIELNKLCKFFLSFLIIAILTFSLVGLPAVLAASTTYTIIGEEIYDKPIKTQIVQHILVSGIPTKAELEAELLKRYRAAKARRGFRYFNPATNIFIYIYGTKQQARAGKGLWIGMIAKGFTEKEPSVVVNAGRLAALSQTPKKRFGLSEQKRKQVFREIAASEGRAMREARARVPDSQVMKQLHLEDRLNRKYKSKIARRHNLSSDQLFKIIVEGVKKGWPH